MHTHAHTHAHTYAHTHMHTHAHTHAHAHTHMHTYMTWLAPYLIQPHSAQSITLTCIFGIPGVWLTESSSSLLILSRLGLLSGEMNITMSNKSPVPPRRSNANVSSFYKKCTQHTTHAHTTYTSPTPHNTHTMHIHNSEGQNRELAIT